MDKSAQVAAAMTKVGNSFDQWMKVLTDPKLMDAKVLSDTRCSFMASVKELESLLLA